MVEHCASYAAHLHNLCKPTPGANISRATRFRSRRLSNVSPDRSRVRYLTRRHSRAKVTARHRVPGDSRRRGSTRRRASPAPQKRERERESVQPFSLFFSRKTTRSIRSSLPLAIKAQRPPFDLHARTRASHLPSQGQRDSRPFVHPEQLAALNPRHVRAEPRRIKT